MADESRRSGLDPKAEVQRLMSAAHKRAFSGMSPHQGNGHLHMLARRSLAVPLPEPTEVDNNRFLEVILEQIDAPSQLLWNFLSYTKRIAENLKCQLQRTAHSHSRSMSKMPHLKTYEPG
jgi:hypothetical protein